MNPFRRLSMLLAMTAAAGCASVAEVAWDSAAAQERRRCEKLESAPERHDCLRKLADAQKQAQTQRQKN